MPTLYSHIFCNFLPDLYLKMLVNVKLDGKLVKVITFQGCRLFGLFKFDWHGQNEVGNIAILGMAVIGCSL